MAQTPKLVTGLYDAAITELLKRELEALEGVEAQIEPLSTEDAADTLARVVHDRVRRALRAVRGADGDDARSSILLAQVRLANALIAHLAGDEASGALLDDLFVAPPSRLLAISPAPAGLGQVQHPRRPQLPLSTSDLLVNGRGDVSLGPEVCRELASADRVDLLCSFLKFSGFRVVRDALAAFFERGGRLDPTGRPRMRVLTTVYMGATERRALDALVDLGAEVRVSLDAANTRLHAKAWLFHRDTSFSTACVGSSNLSSSAMLDGLEWNVRLSNVDNRPILDKFGAVFDQYWADPEFRVYDPDRDAQVFEAARQREQRWDMAEALPAFDLQPRPYQVEMLDALAAERENGHTRNLVVAATGTGKTLVAAFDYCRLWRQSGVRPRLLFVAHREEILKQSRRVFRAVLRVSDFGELLVGGEAPLQGTHVFASVQSLQPTRLQTLAPDAFEIVIVDEFHHAAAPTYGALLGHLRPKYLLGLTATPERTDGLSVLHWFDGRIAAELRLWKALDQGLLSPFQYFGIADQTDLSGARWTHRGYDPAYLSQNVYTANDLWVGRVIQAVRDHVTAPDRMRALGFCVDINHAEFCADRFCRAGIAAAALSTRSAAAERERILGALRDGALRVVFSVDLLNEGIDVPDVDTVLFLRPTESATVFLQQLGRGLRKTDGKTCLTVLDFIGNAHRRFRFDVRYRAIVGGTRSGLLREVQAGFPSLPSGCSMQLDRASSEAVIANIRQALALGRRGFVDDLRGLGPDVGLAEFLRETASDLEDLYNRPNRTFTELLRAAGRNVPAAEADEKTFVGTLARSLHIDDLERLDRYRAIVLGETPPDDQDPFQRMLIGLLGIQGRSLGQVAEIFGALRRNAPIAAEFVELLDVLRDRLRHTSRPLTVAGRPFPLRVHASYALDEISAAIDDRTQKDEVLRIREGVRSRPDLGLDLLFVTLRREPGDYTPTTMYRNFVMSPQTFHWETQSRVAPHHETARRYLAPPPGHRILLFVRHTREDERGLKTPYTLLGPVKAQSASGERPMQIVWILEHEMPPAFFQESKLAAG